MCGIFDLEEQTTVMIKIEVGSRHDVERDTVPQKYVY